MTDAELSKAVADACGIAVAVRESFLVPMWWTECGDMWWPVDDWNDAILAADRFGLFDIHAALIAKDEDGTYRVPYFDTNGEKQISRHQSGPRAICEAIIQIAKGKGTA